MNESAIDSMQRNSAEKLILVAILNTIISIPYAWEYETPLAAAKMLTILINIPLIFVGGFVGGNIANLFLLTNMISVSALVPICFGLIPCLDHFLSGTVALLGSLSAIISVIIYGYMVVGNLKDGIYTYFYTTFSWQAFLVCIGSSILATIFFASVEYIFRLCIGSRLELPVKKSKYVEVNAVGTDRKNNEEVNEGYPFGYA